MPILRDRIAKLWSFCFRILERQAFQLLLAIDQPNEFGSLASMGFQYLSQNSNFGMLLAVVGSIQRLLRKIHNDSCTGQQAYTYIHGNTNKLFQLSEKFNSNIWRVQYLTATKRKLKRATPHQLECTLSDLWGETLNYFQFSGLFLERFDINLMQSLIGWSGPYFSK